MLMKEVSSDHAGHRARLRQRLFDGGPEALLDHEVIEYLLAAAVPRVDTKPVAKALLRQFGSVGGVFAADPEALKQIDGVGDTAAAAIKIVEAAALRLLRARVEDRPVLGSWQALLDYLQAEMAHRPIERVRALYLNSRNVLIADELLSEGTIDETAIYVREVMQRALHNKASALILVHNHPSGDPSPSRQDIDLTRAIAEAGKPLNVTLHDHLIIGASGHASLRGLGLI